MIVIHYSAAFHALSRHIETYNKTVERSETIKSSMLLTAQELIKVYGGFLAKANKGNNIDRDKLPSLRTNNLQLSLRTQSSTRTIRRHLKRLQEVGIITHKIFHGSKASFELCINKEILLATNQLSAKQAKSALDSQFTLFSQSTEKQHDKNNKGTKCPHNTDTGNTRDTNNIIKDVDNLPIQQTPPNTGDETGDNSKRSSAKKQNDLHALTGNILTGNTGGKARKEKNQVTGGKVQKKRGEAEEKTDLKARKEAEARCTSLNFYVKMLWSLAQNILYHGVYLTEKQSESGQKLLFQWYEPVDTAQLSHVHNIYIQRMGLVRKYLDKDPEKRFVQLPNRYFDPQNSNGFAGTKKWYENQKQRKQEVQIKLIVHAQIKRFMNNERKDTAHRTPSLQLFRDCEKRINGLGNPALLKQFHTAVLSPSTSFK